MWKHGLTAHPLFKRWVSFRGRCDNPTTVGYEHYGGRGIVYAEEWNEFIPFYEWAMENGFSPELELDRIDVNGPYAPWNCRWATRKENCQNTRRSVFVEIAGERLALHEAARRYGLVPRTLQTRIRKGMTGDEAVAVPRGVWDARRHIAEWRANRAA